MYCRRVIDWLVAYNLRYYGTGRCAYTSFMDARRAAAEAHGALSTPCSVREPGRRQVIEAMSSFISLLGDAPRNPGSLSELLLAKASTATTKELLLTKLRPAFLNSFRCSSVKLWRWNVYRPKTMPCSIY